MGTLGSWSYDDLGWWANAVHRACSQHACCTPSIFDDMAHTAIADHASFLEGISAFYGETLRRLCLPCLDREGARTMLFRAKALKKWRIADPRHSTIRRREALRGFIRRNAAVDDSYKVPYPYNIGMRMLLESWLPDPERSQWSWTGRFGPGAVAEKLSHPQRFEKLLGWCDFGPHWPEVPLSGEFVEHKSARLHAVPKEYMKDRLITIEPTYASFCQAYLREALQISIHGGPLKGTAMDLYAVDGQVVQQRLAIKASRTKRLATLDLSDASDGISWAAVCEVFPDWVTSLMSVTRSEEFSIDEQIDSHPAGSRFYMNIYAGMGNGSTFTVETLFFAAFVKAYAHAHGLRTFCSVFGDDIICDSEVAVRLAHENFSFFRVNAAKSFWGADALRESCGVFAYNGQDITVPKVDGYLPTLEGRLALSDLHRRLINDNDGFCQRLSYMIASAMPRDGVMNRTLPNWDCRYSGYPSIDDPRVERSQAPQTRWNKALQRREAYLPTAMQVAAKYSTDWVSAKRHNHPDPRVWLAASLSGQLGPGAGFSVRGPSSRRRWSVTVPVKGQLRTKRSWIPEDHLR